jgi:ubiquinone/menaquinone biosynthesis C-methylase UbiE
MIELLWNTPVSETKMARYIESLGLQQEQRVFDVGCGCGEPLIRIFERYGIHGTGIDSSADHISEAQRRSNSRTTDLRIEFVEANAQSFQIEPKSLDLVMCMGATHAFGIGDDAFRNAIEQMKRLAVPNGLLLLADGYMKEPAAAEYRSILGDSMPDDMTHAANVATGQNLGLIPLAAWTSSVDEWDEFEWSYQRIVEQQAVANPDDKKVLEKLTRRREWMDAYLKWGRDTLGYGTYLFRKPQEPA